MKEGMKERISERMSEWMNGWKKERREKVNCKRDRKTAVPAIAAEHPTNQLLFQLKVNVTFKFLLKSISIFACMPRSSTN